MRPNALDELQVIRSLEILAGQENEQGSGIDASVVAFEGYLAQVGHFAAPGLMEDFSGFGIDFRTNFRRLRRRQEMENAFGQPRVKRKTFQSGNDAVPSKRRAVPGHARIRERSFRGFGRHHVQVRNRSTEPAIELLTRSPYFGDFSFEIVDRPFLRVK